MTWEDFLIKMNDNEFPTEYQETLGMYVVMVNVVKNDQGTFRSKYVGYKKWQFSKDALFKNGNIYWRTVRPAGMLIKYKDGTKRFIVENYLL